MTKTILSSAAFIALLTFTGCSTMESGMDTVTETTSDVASGAGDMASDAYEGTKEVTSDTVDGAGDMTSDAYEGTKEAASDAVDAVTE